MIMKIMIKELIIESIMFENDVNLVPLIATILAMNKIMTAIGSRRLKPSANESIRILRISGLELNMLAKYDENDRAKPAAPATASNRMLPAAMKAMKSPNSTRRNEKEPPAMGISTANSV